MMTKVMEVTKVMIKIMMIVIIITIITIRNRMPIVMLMTASHPTISRIRQRKPAVSDQGLRDWISMNAAGFSALPNRLYETSLANLNLLCCCLCSRDGLRKSDAAEPNKLPQTPGPVREQRSAQIAVPFLVKKHRIHSCGPLREWESVRCLVCGTYA